MTESDNWSTKLELTKAVGGRIWIRSDPETLGEGCGAEILYVWNSIINSISITVFQINFKRIKKI